MIPPGHKTWVVGNEPVVGIDFTHLEENTKTEALPTFKTVTV